nr:hypothetical protein [Burkholderia ambifaria]
MNFDPLYARGYVAVQAASLSFLEATDERMAQERAVTLAHELVRVLQEWKLGGRSSTPKARSEDDIGRFLLDHEIRHSLAKLSSLRREPPRLVAGTRVVPGGRYKPDELDMAALRMIVRLADGLFTCCARATYPMKALLLLTGYTVAFDSNVCLGAKHAGFAGMATGFKITSIRESASCPASRKIVSMPYLVGSAWHAEREMFVRVFESIRNDATWAKLVTQLYHPARLFDILFFMQGKHCMQLMQFDHLAATHWYAR